MFKLVHVFKTVFFIVKSKNSVVFCGVTVIE